MKRIDIAVDIGGTFTDLIAYCSETGQILQSKCLSTPPDFATGVMDAIAKAAIELSAGDTFIHGSTVAINTAIERKGATTALVVTKGTRDVYQIGRGNRPESYNVLFKRAEPFVSPHLTYEVEQRTLASGESLISLDDGHLEDVIQTVLRSGVDAVAICFLHAYQNPVDEKRVAEALRSRRRELFVTASHEISRKAGEYERISTCAINAYIGPKSRDYIYDLEQSLRRDGFEGGLFIMQSNGGLMSAATAQMIPVAMMESGPVGGVIAAAQISTALNFDNSISFDMGGTTAKASLIHGSEPSIAEGYFIDGYANGQPAMMPVVDIVEVGTGGGSIAWIDEVGALKVGPESAGARPGPISYRRGGTKLTVTDANVILGRIGAASFLGGEMNLDRDGAASVAAALGERLGMNAVETALSIIDIAVVKMSLAVRGVSVERGFDPRDFVMVATGGAGPLHAAAIARHLHIPAVVIPVLPSHFSAFGMLMSDIRHDYVRTYFSPLDGLNHREVARICSEMEEEGLARLKSENVTTDAVSVQFFMDLRYVGQEFAIKVPVGIDELRSGGEDALKRKFDKTHERSFGHASENEQIEIIALRLSVRGVRTKMRMPAIGTAVCKPHSVREAYLVDASAPVRCDVYARPDLSPSIEIMGPALIEEYGTTTVVFPGDRATVSKTGEIIIKIGGKP